MTEHAYEYLPEDTPWDEYHQPAADAVAAMYQEPEIEAPRPGPDNAFGAITPEEIRAMYDAIVNRPDAESFVNVTRMVRWAEAKYRVSNAATLTALAAAEKKLQERTEWLAEAVQVISKQEPPAESQAELLRQAGLRIAELEAQLAEVKRQSLQCEARYANLLSRSDEIIGRLRGQLKEAQGWEPVVREGGSGAGYRYEVRGDTISIMMSNIHVRVTLPPHMRLFRTFDVEAQGQESDAGNPG